MPSRDGSQLAIVNTQFERQDDKNVLVLTDLNGKIKSTLATGNQIYGLSWSANNSKLAYGVASNKKNNSGSYISDLKTGQQVKIVNDTHFAAKLPWSPSGNKILVPSPTTLKPTDAPIDKTYLATIS